jgi:hypothetical protein
MDLSISATNLAFSLNTDNPTPMDHHTLVHHTARNSMSDMGSKEVNFPEKQLVNSISYILSWFGR